MPPKTQHIGNCEVVWDPIGEAEIYVYATGGTVEERQTARKIVQAQLSEWYEPVAQSERLAASKYANWSDIMDKARRLLSDGAVQVLRNGYNNIVAQVRGDHGNYQSEIFRQDPNSRAITGSDCECGWGEFQNQPRTRTFKRFQDRPCSHILAAFWQAQSMPLDEDAHPDAQDPSGGAGGPAGGAAPPTMGPEADQGFDPAQRSFDPSMSEGMSAGPGGPQGGPEEPQGPSPADVLPQYPMENMPQPPATNPISSPAFMPGPTPTSPVAMPPGGALSSVQPWRFATTAAAGDGDSAFELPPTAEPVAPPPMKNGDLVQLRYPDTGTLVGRSEAHGAGQPCDLVPGMVGEFLGTDPASGMHSVLWMGKQWDKNKEMEPYGATGFHWPSWIIPRPDLKRPGPAIRRRR